MEVPTNYMNSHPLTFDAGIHMSYSMSNRFFFLSHRFLQQ